MKLEIDTLLKKKIFNANKQDEAEGIGILELTAGSCKFVNNWSSVRGFYVVPEDGSMRPDLVVNQIYSDTSYTGSFLKYNDICNPFSIESGQGLMVPDQNYLEKSLSYISPDKQQSNTPSKDLIAYKEGQISKSERDLYLELKTKNSQATFPKPPNFSEPGETETTKANGLVSFGPFAGGPSTTNVDNPYFTLTKNSLNK
jgi:hypothetical protein